MKFVEMSEITLDDPPPTGLPITDISVWVERFCAILTQRFPVKAPEMLASSS